MKNQINNITKLRTIYPYATIEFKAQVLNLTHVRLSATISTGRLPDGSDGVTLVDLDSIYPLDEANNMKEKCISEALAFAGFAAAGDNVQVGHSSSASEENDLTDEPAAGDALTQKAEAAGKKRRKKASNKNEAESDISAVAEKTPAEMDAPDVEDENANAAAGEREVASGGEGGEVPNEEKSPEMTSEPSLTGEGKEPDAVVERGVEDASGEKVLESLKKDAESEEHVMTYEEACNVILVVNDAAKAKAMKEFVGKPMYVINSSRPTLLRFLVRATDKGEELVSKECAEAARILMAKTR